MKSFSQSLESTLPENEISIYRGSLISDENIVKYSIKIRQAFSSLPPEFYGILLEMAKEEKFTDERFRDAVHHVIKTCIYPTPTIAQFISFDKKVKLFTYEDMVKKTEEFGPGIWDSYKPIQFPDRIKKTWVHVDDIKKYNLK
jgi:hypothetical protein